MARWKFTIEQGGMTVASGSAGDRDTALREAAHYTVVYGQDGPAIAKVEPVKCDACEDTGTVWVAVDGDVTCPECGY